MKKFYLSIITITFTCNVNAQLSLTKLFNEPILGDVNTTHSYDTTSALPNNMGMSQVWDFSALTTNTVMQTGTYTTAASTPHGSNYAGATLAENDGVGGYTYSKVTPTQFELVGIETPSIALNFTNTAIAAIWPVAFGYNNSDTFSGSAAANGTLTGTAIGTVNTIANGTGTLIIPGGTSFTNVLQVKSSQKINVSLGFGFVTATITAVDYSYYHSSQKFPILNVSYNNIQGSFSSNTGTVKVNNAVITGINDLNFDASFSIYPNPAKDYFQVKLNNLNKAVCKVDIINSAGLLTQTINLGNESEILSMVCVSNLKAGLYMVKTTLGNKISIRKLIIE